MRPAGRRDRCMLLLGRGPSTAGSRSPICPSPTSRSTTTSSPLDIRSSMTDQEAKGRAHRHPRRPRPAPRPSRGREELPHSPPPPRHPRRRALPGPHLPRHPPEPGRRKGTRRLRHRGRRQRLGPKPCPQGRRQKLATDHCPRAPSCGAQAIAEAAGDPTRQGRWKPGSAVVKREYLDRAQSRAENPWLRVQAKRRGKPA